MHYLLPIILGVKNESNCNKSPSSFWKFANYLLILHSKNPINKATGQIVTHSMVAQITRIAFEIFDYLAKWLPELVTVVSIGMMIVYLIAGILLMKALFDLRRIISSDDEEDGDHIDTE